MTRRAFEAGSIGRQFAVDLLERRVLLSGELDPTFGIGGFTQGQSSSALVPTYSCTILATESDGKLLGLGNSDKTGGTFAFRFLSNGALDSSFGHGGIALVGDKGQGVFILQLAAGNYVVAVNGIQTQIAPYMFSSSALYELSNSGAVDDSFGGKGRVDIESFGTAKYGAIQGNSILVGVSETEGGTADNLGKVFKYGPDGVLDNSFGKQGEVNLSSDINGMVVNAAGDIVVFGSNKDTNTAGLYYLDSDGRINPSLGSNQETPVNGLVSLLAQTDSAGRFYYATTASSSAYTLHRLSADGSMDSTFNAITVTGNGTFAVEADGSLLSAAGTNFTPAIISHFSPAGTLEGSGEGSAENFGLILPLLNGAYLVAGTTSTLKYTVDNVLDTSFGTAGMLTALDVSHPPATYSAIDTQSDGKIVVAGIAAASNGEDFYVTRFKVNGSIDDSFGDQGIAEVAFGALQVGSVTMITEPDDSIIVAGNYSNPALSDASASGIVVTKLTSSGSVVSSFGSGGTVTLPGENAPSLGWQEGKLLVASKTTLRRYNSDGIVDSSFATGLPGGTISAVEADGQILYHATDNLSFPSYYENGLYHLNADGTLDTHFVRYGFFGLSTYQDSLDGAVVESSGRIVTLGLIYGGPQIYLALTALNSDGSADTSFGSLGSTQVNDGAYLPHPSSLLLQPDGELLVVIPQELGSNTVGSTLVVERFSATGQLDTGFGVNGSVQIGASATPPPAIDYVPVNVGSITTLDGSGRLLMTGAGGTVGPDIFAMSTTGQEVPGPAVKMVIVSQPTDQFEGSEASFAVAMEDANGAVATGDTSRISYYLNSTPRNTEGIDVLGGFASARQVGIYNLTASTDNIITLTDPEAPSITTSAFNVYLPGQIVSQPTGNIATGELAPIVVDLFKPDGTIDTANDSYVTLTGADFSGTTIVAAVNGVATFNNLSIFNASEENSLAIAVGGFSFGSSETFNTVVVPQLVFVDYPASSISAGALGPVSINLLDENGNLLTSDDESVSIGTTVGSNVKLGGTLTVNAVNGVATFDDLSIATAGSQYHLYAYTDGDSNVAGAAFSVVSNNATPPGTTPPVSTPPGTTTTPSTLALSLKTVRLAAENVAGAKLNSLIPVVITNTGAAIKGVVLITIYADESASPDSNAVLAATFPEKLALKSGKQKAFNLGVKSLPATLSPGKYYLVVEVTDPSDATSVVSTQQTVLVDAPVVKAIAEASTLAFKPISSRQSVSVLVTFGNEGNIAGRDLEITVTAIAGAGTTPLPVPVQVSLKRTGNFRAQGLRYFRLTIKANLLPAGVYYPAVSVSLDGSIATASGTAFTIA